MSHAIRRSFDARDVRRAKRPERDECSSSTRVSSARPALITFIYRSVSSVFRQFADARCQTKYVSHFKIPCVLFVCRYCGLCLRTRDIIRLTFFFIDFLFFNWRSSKSGPDVCRRRVTKTHTQKDYIY